MKTTSENQKLTVEAVLQDWKGSDARLIGNRIYVGNLRTHTSNRNAILKNIQTVLDVDFNITSRFCDINLSQDAFLILGQ